jgi:hypothetical protein
LSQTFPEVGEQGTHPEFTHSHGGSPVDTRPQYSPGPHDVGVHPTVPVPVLVVVLVVAPPPPPELPQLGVAMPSARYETMIAAILFFTVGPEA